MVGVSVTDTTLGTTVGNLGMTDVRFPKPVFHGDTLHSTTTIKDKRESKSRPTMGIVVFEHRASISVARKSPIACAPASC